MSVSHPLLIMPPSLSSESTESGLHQLYGVTHIQGTRNPCISTMHLILCIIGTIRRANATAKAKGYPAWYIRGVFLNKDERMDEYHIRSVVESVFSSIKRCFGTDIKRLAKAERTRNKSAGV